MSTRRQPLENLRRTSTTNGGLWLDKFICEQAGEDKESRRVLVQEVAGIRAPGDYAHWFERWQRAPIVYLQSEGGQSLLYHYEFDNNELVFRERIVVGALLTISDYLKVHALGRYRQRTDTEPFQQLVFRALQPHVSEIISSVSLNALEIDLMIRCGNQVGIAEVKSGKAAERKDGIDQLNTASQREFLGTYTKRFLILNRELGTNNRELAQAHNIIVIELLGNSSGKLSEDNQRHLIEKVTQALGGRPC